MPDTGYGHMNLLLTGASGQLGRRLLPRLIESGYSVKAHYRSNDKARMLCPNQAETVVGDLREPDWLEKATQGCGAVIHAAARVSLRLGNREEQRQVNVEGTRAVIEACRKNRVKRLVYISSIVAVGASKDGNPVDEALPYNLGGYDVPYVDTKHKAEKLALEANGPDLEVVVVNPSIMISPPDRPVTKADLRKIPRLIPAYFDFGLNVVETDDVITGVIAALERGRAGERYLLTGENLFPKRAFELGKKYFGIRRLPIKIPLSMLIPIGALFELWAELRGTRPRFHRGLAKLALYRFVYSNEKARRELGFCPKRLEETIENILRKIDLEER